MRIAACIVTLSMLTVLAACSSSGTFNSNVDLYNYQNVYISDQITVFDQRYLPPVVQALQNDGYPIVKSPNEPETLTLKFAINTTNLNYYQVTIQLWAGDQLVIDAESKKSAQGTHAGSDSSLKHLVARAIAEMQKEIQKNKYANGPRIVPIC